MSTKPRERRHQSHANSTDVRKGTTTKPVAVEPTISAEERSRLIQERAYCLWERAGRPDGDAARERFWCEAEAEILNCPANGMACHEHEQGGTA